MVGPLPSQISSLTSSCLTLYKSCDIAYYAPINGLLQQLKCRELHLCGFKEIKILLTFHSAVACENTILGRAKNPGAAF